MKPSIVTLSKSESHSMQKYSQSALKLISGYGIEGDVHAGGTVKHRSRRKKNSELPNLRQVHLIHSELYEELRLDGFVLNHGELGENITTKDLNLLNLPEGTILNIGPDVKIEITGLRNPCSQLDDLRKGLMKAVLERSETGELIRKTGVMAIVISGGEILLSNTIDIEYPSKPHRKLVCV